MLNEQTLTQLRALRLDGMVAALADHASSRAASELRVDERLALLVQREIDWRQQTRRQAPHPAAQGRAAEGQRRVHRGHQLARLAGPGPAPDHGAGRQAAREGFTVPYTRTTRLPRELRVAHGDGSFSRRLAQLARFDVLVLDDFAGAPMEPGERNDLLELLDDRVGANDTLITSQLAVKVWHAWLDDPTVADAILDSIALKCASLRKPGRRGTPMIASRRHQHARSPAKHTACPPRRSVGSSQAPTDRRRGQACSQDHQPFSAELPIPVLRAGVDT
jgi:hypothetical protein